MKTIRNLVNCIETVPTLPSVVSKVIKTINDPRSSAQSVAKAISSDTAISSRVLKVVNSVYYGFPLTNCTNRHQIQNKVREILPMVIFFLMKHKNPYRFLMNQCSRLKLTFPIPLLGIAIVYFC